MIDENVASKEELWQDPEGSRFRYKLCRCSIRNVKRFMRSGLLLKGFALAFGLWNPRRRCRAIFALIFLLVEVYLSIQKLIGCLTESTLDSLCGNNSLNITSTPVERVGTILLPYYFRKVFLMKTLVTISRLFSHLTFFWSVWMLSKENTCVKQENTLTLINSSRWLKLNCVLLLFWCALISCTVWVVVENTSSNPIAFVVGNGVSLWISLVTVSSFGTLTSSLETLATSFILDIKTSEHLDNVIKQHQQLCKIIFGTSNALKMWFIVHWIMFTISCVFWVANFLTYFRSIFQYWSLFFYNIVCLVFYSYIFIYPCYRAAVLTGKCQQMLADFNLTTEEDWPNNHPFRKRSNLHFFLQYAKYADCGYRVGRFTFGSMSVFFSTLLTMVGIGLKVL